MADDLNEAIVDGSQKWKLFKAWYQDTYPDDSLDLNNEPPEVLEEKLKDRGIEKIGEFLKAREDFWAEQNALGARTEDKEEEPKEQVKTERGHSRRHPVHAHETTHDEFVLKNLSVAKSWSNDLKKKNIRNEHLNEAIKRDAQKRLKGAQGEILREETVARPRRSISIPSFPRMPSISIPSIRVRSSGGTFSPVRLTGRGARNIGKRALKTAAKTSEKAAARFIIAGLGLPFIIIGFFILLIIFVLLFFLFFLNSGSGTTPPPNLPSGISYMLIAPPAVRNGQIIDYRIIFYYDFSTPNIPPLESLSLVDSIPLEADLASATQPYSYNPDARTVTWKISSFLPRETQGSTKRYYFDISLQPNQINTIVQNSLCLEIEGQESICPVGLNEPPPEASLEATPSPTHPPGGGP